MKTKPWLSRLICWFSFRNGCIVFAFLGQGMLFALKLNAAPSQDITITVTVPTETTSPAGITDLVAATGSNEGEINVTWTAPGDNGYSGSAYEYVVKVATYQITTSSFNNAPLYSQNWDPFFGRKLESHVISGLVPGITYYVAIAAKDIAGNQGPWESSVDNPGVNAGNFALAAISGPRDPTLSIDLTQTTTTQIRWLLTDNADNETGLYINTNVSTTTRISPNLGPLASTGSITGYLETGMAPNTPYTRYGEAYNVAGSSFSAVFTRYTLANPPLNLSVISVSTNSVVMAWNTNGNPSGTPFFVERDINSNGFNQIAPNITTNTYTDMPLVEGSTYSYNVYAKNEDGITTSVSNTISIYIKPKDTIPPQIASYSPSSPIQEIEPANIAPDTGITITFNKAMHTSSLTKAFSLRAIQNRLGSGINEVIAGSLILDGLTLSFRPNEPLKKNHRYEVSLSTEAMDLAGNHLNQSLQMNFRTIFDSTIDNVFYGRDGKTWVRIPAGALPQDGYFQISLNPFKSPLGALSTTISEANDKDKARHGEIFAPLLNTIKEFRLLSLSGEDLGQSLLKPAEICLPYGDEDNDGFVTSNNLKIHERFLGVVYLNELAKLWVISPGASVDPTNKTVRVRVTHFSVYAIKPVLANFVGDAYAYPVPFVPTQGHQKITFTNLAMDTTIRVYTISGELVTELHENDGNGQLEWDVKNENGENVFSGVYVYIIKSGSEQKTGKLVIIR